MKTQSSNFLETLSATELKTLVTQVEETIAFNSSLPAKTFTAADLWSIQRQSKGFSGRRSLRVYC